MEENPLIVEEVIQLLALLHLDLIEPVEAIKWAERKLSEGEESGEVIALASLLRSDSDRVSKKLDDLAQSLKIPSLTTEDAGLLAAGFTAAAVLKDEILPIEGARRIWAIARTVPTVEPYLREFIGLASEWDDSRDYRSEYDCDILRHAQSLVSEVPRLLSARLSEERLHHLVELDRHACSNSRDTSGCPGRRRVSGWAGA